MRASHEFHAVRKSGRMAQGRTLRMSVLEMRDTADSRLGVVTSRRVGGAVQRNRMRRRIREIFRTHRAGIRPGLWVVVTAKAGSGEATFDEVREEWLRLGTRLSIFRNS